MPPKKRSRTSAVTAKDPPPTSDGHFAADVAGDNDADADDDDNINDPWTDEQETSLFKSLIRWKPTGLHKHMHMIQIALTMSREGFSYQQLPVARGGGGGGGGASAGSQTRHAAAQRHTRIPGIWKKLDKLYDLDTLDERENSRALADWPDVAERDSNDDDDDQADDGRWFQLPHDEFAQLLWDRRIAGSGASDGSESPVACPELLAKPGDPTPGAMAGDVKPVGSNDVRLHSGSSAPGRTRAPAAARRGARATVAVRSRRGRAARRDSTESRGNDESGDEKSSGGEDNEMPPASDRGRAPRGRRRGTARGGRGRGSSTTRRRSSGRRK